MNVSHVVFTPIVMFIEKIGPHPSSFRIPQILTTDQGSLFMSHQVPEFAEFLKIKLLSSSPYYAQTNGQTESSNKTLIKLIKKKIEENPKRWHEVLSEVLWTHRIY
jgi:transposase InsO family protein